VRALAIAAAVIVALGGALVAFAPASLVGSRVEPLTSGRVRLVANEGTLWSGRAIAVLGDDAVRIPVAWRVEPWPLLRGEVRIALAPPADAAGAPRGRIVLVAGRTNVEALELSLPAAAAAALLAARQPAPLVRAGGLVTVRVDDLAIGHAVERGSVRLEWRDARLAQAAQPTLELGTITASLAARDGTLAGPIAGRDGAIRIDGETSLTPTGARIAARLAPEPTASAAVRQALSRLGPPADDGSVSLNLAGSLPR
jgi:hypothetical protein